MRERGVIRVAASYAVIAWLLLQIADVTFEPLGVPRWVMVSLIVTAILGESARVDTDVATAFAVSWKPFVKSKASAVPTTMTRMTSELMPS